jgi:3'-5' exoribonuclease
LLSHHGQYEYGSPKRPKTLEAIALNFLDDLDSKMNGVQSHIDKNSISDSPWTSYHRLYNRYFYTGESPAAGEEKPAETPAPMAKPVEKIVKPVKKDEPLGVSLGDRLKGESLDLFSVPVKDGAKDAD